MQYEHDDTIGHDKYLEYSYDENCNQEFDQLVKDLQEQLPNFWNKIGDNGQWNILSVRPAVVAIMVVSRHGRKLKFDKVLIKEFMGRDRDDAFSTLFRAEQNLPEDSPLRLILSDLRFAYSQVMNNFSGIDRLMATSD